jgi:hypothetical protein
MFPVADQEGGANDVMVARKHQHDPLADLFERVYQLRKSEELQNERMPDELREIAQQPSVDQNDAAFGSFGQTHTNPIPVNGPIGEILYLSELKHKSGLPILFHRLGSIFKTDVFEIATMDLRFWDVIYLDMYHPRKSRLAPDGYNIWSTNDDSKRYLMGGTNSLLPHFPRGIFDAVARDTKAIFGMSLADPTLKVVDQRSEVYRPVEHRHLLQTLTSSFEGNGTKVVTPAICMICGNPKFGCLVACKRCEFRPETGFEMGLSLVNQSTTNEKLERCSAELGAPLFEGPALRGSRRHFSSDRTADA